MSNILRRILVRLVSPIARRQDEARLREEIDEHLALQTGDNIKAGFSPHEARRRAILKFGAVEAVKEDCRDQRSLPLLEDLFHDTRYAVRTLRKSPSFTSLAVLTLALGIGANAAIFSVIRAVLLKPPPYADADRLVRLSETRPNTPGYSGAISAPNYLDWAQQNTVFEQMAAVTGGSATLSRGTTNPVFVEGRTVSASYFEVFGLRAALGRTFASDEGHPDKRHVVVLSHRLWTSQFGSNPAVIGEAIQLDSEMYTVIGVMPAGTGVDLLDPELWRPRDLGHEGGALTQDGPAARDRHDLNLAVAKLKRGVTLEQARTQMETLAGRLARAYPESNQGWGVRVQPWPRPVGPDFERSL
jgi:putative ABC transport system permease protein